MGARDIHGQKLLITVILFTFLVISTIQTTFAHHTDLPHLKSQKVALVPDDNGLGHSGTLPRLSGYDFTNLDPLTVAKEEDLHQFDTIVLYQFCNIGDPPFSTPHTPGGTDDFIDSLLKWITDGGKLLILDSDSCNASDGIPAVYSWLRKIEADFQTFSPGQLGLTGGVIKVVEENKLSSSDPASASFVDTNLLTQTTDAVGDLNVIQSKAPVWCADMEGTNTLGESGFAHAYTKPFSIGAGWIIYNGLDYDFVNDTVGTGGEVLRKIYQFELDHGWGGASQMADLKCGTPVLQRKVPLIILPGNPGSRLVDGDIREPPEADKVFPEKICRVTEINAVDFVTIQFQLTIGHLLAVPDIIRKAPTLQKCSELRDSYDSLIKFLESQGYVEGVEIEGNIRRPILPLFVAGVTAEFPTGATLFVFPYDWRRDLREAASNLAHAIEWVTRNTKSKQVDILTHSTGALVTQSCINSNVLGCSDRIRRVIHIAPPNQGLAQPYIAAQNYLGPCMKVEPAGHENQFCPREFRAFFQSLAADYPAFYQLLPRERYFELHSWDTPLLSALIDYFVDDEFSFLAGFSIIDKKEGPLRARAGETAFDRTFKNNEDTRLRRRDLADDAKLFHDEVKNGLKFNGEVYNIVGSGRPTPVALRIGVPGDVTCTSNQVTFQTTPAPVACDPPWDAIPNDGDGLITFQSATTLEINTDYHGKMRIFWVDSSGTLGEHGDLPKNPLVKQAIMGILDAPDFDHTKNAVCGLQNMNGFDCGSPFPSPMFTTRLVVHSPVLLKITDANSNVTSMDSSGFIITNTPNTNFLVLGESQVAFIPNNSTYHLELRATAAGTFNFIVTQFQGAGPLKGFQYLHVAISEKSLGTIDYDPNFITPPNLFLDVDGDGTVDKVIPPSTPNSLFTDSVESGLNGWTPQGLWHITQKSSCVSPNSSFPSPASAWYFGVDSNCQAQSGGGALSSPTIIIPPGINKAFVSFDYFLNLSNQPSKAVVLASFNKGGKAKQIWKGSLGVLNQWTSSGNIAVPVPKGASTINLQFVVYTLPKRGVPAIGWFVDNIQICGVSPCSFIISSQQVLSGFNAGDIVPNPALSAYESIDQDSIEFHTQEAIIQTAEVEVFALDGTLIFNSGPVSGDTVRWKTKDSEGHSLANGVYLYVLTTMDQQGSILKSEVRKLIIKR